MKTIRLSLVFILVLSTSAMAADWISLDPDSLPGATPEIKCISSNFKETRMEIVLPGFFIEQTEMGTHITVPGWATTRKVGLPALPEASMLLALPTGDGFTLDVQSSKDYTFSGYQIMTLQEPEVDGMPLPDPVEPLSWTGSYPAAGASEGTCGFIKDLPVASIQAYPFHVDSQTGVLTVSGHMLVTVHHSNSRDLWPAVYMPDSIKRRCAASVMNFDSIPQSQARTAGIQYLIICRNYSQAYVQQLATWKNKMGYKTETRVLTSVNQTAIKNIIMEYPDVEFVLLVGDSADVPLAYWSGDAGDYWYSCTTGGSNPDLYADLSIGRLCGSDEARLTPQISKILNYSKSPPLNEWLKHTVLVANGEQYPGKYTQCKNEIATALDLSSNWMVTKHYGGESGKTNAGVTALINEGVNLLNYRGHGYTQEWSSWNLLWESYTNTDVEALSNGDMRPVVLNIACCCSDISQYCMSEAWMDASGGAVASLGAIDPSYTIPNHDYDKEIYKAFFELDIGEIGLASLHATDFIINNHGGLGEDNAKMYIWLGDPSMKLWPKVPGSFTVAYPESITLGPQDFTVNVAAGGGFATAGALVCVYKADEVHETGVTDSGGNVTLNIDPQTAGSIYVTVTHSNYLPNESMGEVGSLVPDATSISASAGGVVNFDIDAGAVNAGRNYILLGTVSGTTPGTALPGGLVTMPLNFDIFTDIVLANLNSVLFTDFYGTLDGNGEATAQLNAPILSGSLAGTVMNYAYAMNFPWDFASNAASVTIEP